MNPKKYPVIYNQNNYPDHLGQSHTDTIASGGCFVSCLAMKACLYGHQIDPVQMNQAFIDKKVYVSAGGSDVDLLPDNALALIFSDAKYIKTFDYEPIPTDLQNIANLLQDNNTTLTIRIRYASGGFHFVEAVACDPNAKTLHIANPYSGKIEDFAQNYGNPVTANLHVLVYSGPVAQPQQQSVAPDASQPSPLAQRFTQAITKSSNFDKVADFLGISQDQRVTTDAGQLAVDKYKFLQDEVDSLHKQLEAVQKQTVSPTLGNPPQDAPAKPSAPQEATPTFSNGQVAVSSTPQSVAPLQGSTGLSPAIRAKSMSFLGLIRDIIKTLLF